MQQNEKTINVIDLILYVIERWYVGVVAIVVGIVFGLGVGAIAQYMETESMIKEAQDRYEKAVNSNVIDEEENSERLEKLEDRLDIADFELINLYHTYHDSYESQLTFVEQDALMQYDANNVCFKKLMYTITSEESDNIQILGKYYRQLLENDGDLNPFIEIDEEYTGIVSLTEEDFSYSNGNDACILYITVKGVDETDAGRISNKVQRIISGAKVDASELYGGHELDCLESESYIDEDTSIIEYQKKYIDYLYSYRERIIAIENNFSDRAKKYMNEYQKQQLQLMKLAIDDIEDIEEPDYDSIHADFSKKVFILAIAGVFLLTIVGIIMRYILSPYIRLNEDIKNVTDVSVLSRIVSSKRIRGIRKIRYGNIMRFNEQEAIKMAASSIRVYIKNQNLNKLYITGTVMGDLEKDMAAKVIDAVNMKGVDIEIGESFIYNAEAREAAYTVGNVILLERAGVTKTSELCSEITDLENNVMGIILFE